MNRQRFEVPADGNRLFRSVCVAYLIPAIDEDEKFRRRFMKLFGYRSIFNINHVHHLLKRCPVGLYSNYSEENFYKDSTLKTLVSETFRAKIIDVLQTADVKSRCLKSTTLDNFRESHNEGYITPGTILTHLKQQFKNMEMENFACSQIHNIEETIKQMNIALLNVADKSEINKYLYDLYLKRITENASSWGGKLEILAMSYALNSEIKVDSASGSNVIKWDDYDRKVQLFYNGTVYSFRSKSGTADVTRSYNCSSQQGTEEINEAQPSSQHNSTQLVIQPDVFSSMKMEYDASGLNSLLHGPAYQVKLLLLFLIRALNRQSNFRLASEWKEAEKFDDLVYLFQNESDEMIGWFLQAKHKKDESKRITYDDLIFNGKKGEFTLEKYFISYVKMKNNSRLNKVNIETLLILTNIDFDEKTVKAKKLLEKIFETSCPMLDFEDKFATKTPTRYRLIPDENIKAILRICKINNKRLLPAQTVDKYIDEFFRKLTFAVDQPNEEELDHVIKKEVGFRQEMSTSFNCNKDLADQAQRNLLEFFKHEQVKFITRDTGNAIFEMPSSRLAIGLGQKYVSESKLRDYSQGMEIDNLLEINRWLENDQNYLIKSDIPLLTLIKIYQCLVKHTKYKEEGSHIIIDLVSLLEDRKRICILNALNDHHRRLLVIDCHNYCTEKELNEKRDRMKNLFKILLDNKIKLFAIYKREINIEAEISRQFSLTSDKTSFSDLSTNGQNIVLNKSVKFQGDLIELSELSEDRNDWNEILDGKIIADLIKADEIVEIGVAPPKLSQSEAAFAKRYKTIDSENLLQTLKLGALNAEIFLFSENIKNVHGYIDRFTQLLFKITPEANKSPFKNCFNMLDTRLNIDYANNCKKINILLNEKDETNLEVFKKICYFNARKFVYWLEIVNDEFHWLQVYDPQFYIKRQLIKRETIENENVPPQLFKAKKSKKKMADHSLYKNISYVLGEEMLANDDEHLVLIVAEPGMGKSTTLTRLSEYKLKVNWVFRVNLRDCERHLLSLPEDYTDAETTIRAIVEFLLRVSYKKTPNRMTINLLRYSLLHKMRKPLLILCDGYDEINRNCQLKFKQLIIYLKERPFLYLWISSRKEHTKDLEKSLDIPSTKFKELLSDEKYIYLLNFYKIKFKLQLNALDHESVFRRDTGNFDVFFKPLIKKVDRVLNKTQKSFMGVPLQLRLLAESFLPEFEAFVTGNETAPDFEHLDLSHFYQRFINVKYEIYFREKTKLSVGLSRESERWLTDDLHRLHQRVALKQQFPDRFNSLIRGVKSPFRNGAMDPEQELELKRVGILQGNPFEDRLEFIHRTFAEYFVAQFLLRKLRRPHCPQLPESIQNLMLDVLQGHNVICMLLNEQITEEDLSAVRCGCMDKRVLLGLHKNLDVYKNLRDFLLTFFVNKVWILKELDFKSYLHSGLRSENRANGLECLIKLTKNHYDVVRKYLLDEDGKSSTSLRDAASGWPVNKKARVDILMKAIHCYPKIIEELTRDYYVEDLCEIFKNDEDLCQWLKKLTVTKATPFEVEANKLLRNLVKTYDENATIIKMSKKCNRSTYPGFSKKNTYHNLKHIEVEYFKSKPYKIRSGKELKTLEVEIDKILRLGVIKDRKLSPCAPQLLNLDEALILENVKKYHELIQDIRKVETNNTATVDSIEIILDSALTIIQNEDDAIVVDEKLKYLPHINIASLCFKEYKTSLDAILHHETGANFLIDRFKDDPINYAYLFSLVVDKHPQYTQRLLHSVECKEMKELLSHLYDLRVLKNSINSKDIREFGSRLLEVIEKDNSSQDELLEILQSVEHANADKIAVWIKENLNNDNISQAKLKSKQNLEAFLKLLSSCGKFSSSKTKKNRLFTKGMLNCMKHFPSIFHFIILNCAQSDLHSRNQGEKMYKLFDSTLGEFPKTAACLVILLTHNNNNNSPLYFGLKNNSAKFIKLLFEVLNPYPNVLKHLILMPSREISFKNGLHYAMTKCESKTLEVFLAQLNRNMDAIEHVINNFVVKEEDKFTLFEMTFENDPHSLLIFFTFFKSSIRLFRQFFIPVDCMTKPAFYLAAERGCKEVIDVLLEVLKCEGDVLWQLLIWSSSGKTVLHRAAEKGYSEIVDAILSSVRKQKQKLETLLLMKDSEGHTVLDCAVASEVQIVRIRNDFNVDLRCELMDSEDYKNLKDNFGKENSIESLMKLASNLKNIPTVVNLILIMVKHIGKVELMLAMFENEEMRLALESINVTLENYSYNLFYCSIQRNSVDLIDRLVAKGIDVNCSNGYGYTPLMKAVQKGNINICQSLLNKGADIYVQNMHGKSAYSIASTLNGKSKIHKLFENK